MGEQEEDCCARIFFSFHFLFRLVGLVLPLREECRHDVLHARPRLVEQYDSLL